MDLSAYLAIFLDESRENLQQLNQHLLALEDDADDRTTLDAIFRVAHTLKGMAATMGFQAIADLTHKMEELLDLLRNGQVPVSQGICDTLFACLDSLEALVDAAASGTAAPDVTDLVARLKREMSGDAAPPTTAAAAPQANGAGSHPFTDTEAAMISEARGGGYEVYEAQIFLMAGCLMKSLRVTLVMRALEPLGTVIRTIPSVQEMEADAMDDSFRLTLISLDDPESVRQAILSVAEIQAVTIEPVRAGADGPADLPGPAVIETPGLMSQLSVITDSERRLLQEAARQGLSGYGFEVFLQPGTALKSARAIIVVRQLEARGELIKVLPSAEAIENEAFGDSFALLLLTKESPDELKKLVEGVAEVERVLVERIAVAPPPHEEAKQAQVKEAQLASNGSRPRASATIRVDTDKLDELMNLMGELVISRTRLNQLAMQTGATEISQAVQHLSTITSDLQTVAMKLRMVSIEHVFNRFPRMVRDLGKTLGKEIELTIIGQETELDRSVIDMIGDPLVHLIRNSADHGLESTDGRLAAGKSATGHIRLEAKQEGGMVVISVEDDGRGLDPASIRAKALAKKLITAEQAAAMDDWESNQLIFLAGFSTRDQANEISGRGVGLDAVKELVNQMGGLIEMHSEFGQGTRFAIKLPLTLAIMQALLTRVHQEIYAIPLSAVEEAVSIKPEQVKFVQSQPVIVLRGETIPLIHLTERLDVPFQAPGTDVEMPVVIVNQASGAKGLTKTGLVVSTLIGQEEIVIKPLSRTVRTSPYIAGAATLGDGSIALILNTPSLS